MADTKAEQIMAAVTTLMGGLNGITVYRSRVDALSRRQAPALVISQEGNVPGTTPVSTCKIEWDLTINLEFYCRGAIPDAQASPFIEAAHALLMADRSIGGRAINTWPGPQQPQLDPTDSTALWMVCPYVITHRTTQENISA